MQIKTREYQRLKEVAQLREEMEKLQQTNQDLQLALSTTAEYGNLIVAQLYNTDKQLQAEIAERKRAESSLEALVTLISEHRDDL